MNARQHWALTITLTSLLLGSYGVEMGYAQIIDDNTQRNFMHSCPSGQFVVGVHADNNLLLCSQEFGGYLEALEIVDYETQSEGMHSCPDGMAMTGLHVGRNILACAPVARPLQRFVDTSTQRFGMHACPEGNPVSGIHVGKNLLLCGTNWFRYVRPPDSSASDAIGALYEVECLDMVEPNTFSAILQLTSAHSARWRYADATTWGESLMVERLSPYRLVLSGKNGPSENIWELEFSNDYRRVSGTVRFLQTAPQPTRWRNYQVEGSRRE